MGRLSIALNSTDNLRDLLQEAYKLSDEQIVQSQNEITKLANATRLQDEVMDAKEKYAKAINNYLSIKDKAISKKLEIAKILQEIIKYNGDVNNALKDESLTKGMTFDFSKIRDIVNNSYDEKNKTEKIDLKK